MASGTSLHMPGRFLANPEAFIDAATARGMAAQQFDFSGLGFAEQLAVMANTSVFVSVHGAATAMLCFLPPWGASVELKPFKFSAR